MVTPESLNLEEVTLARQGRGSQGDRKFYIVKVTESWTESAKGTLLVAGGLTENHPFPEQFVLFSKSNF